MADPGESTERKFRVLFDAMPQLGWSARPDGYIEFYNRGWYEYTGTTPEQMVGWGWRSVHDPELLPAVESRWRHSIETGTAFEMTFPLRRRDGVFRWFLTRVNPVRDEHGQVIHWVGINTDIDDQRHSEQQLAVVLEDEQHARQRSDHLAAENARLYREARDQMQAHVELNRALREALQSAAREAADRERAELEVARQREDLASMWMQAPIPICVIAGDDLVFELANPPYLKLVGGRDVVGKPLAVALPESKGQGYDELLHGVMQSGQPVIQNESLVKLERGGVLEDLYVTFIYSPLRNSQGTTDRVLAVVNDVTEQVRARKRVETLAADLATEKRRLEAALAQVRKLG